MKITREGITFTYKGIAITYHWPLLQTYFYQARFIIPILKYESNSIFDCFSRINELANSDIDFQLLEEGKVQGFKYSDIVRMAAYTFFKNKCGIVIHDVNVQAKPAEFWSNVPKSYIKQFLKDVVFITCKTPEEVTDLMYSIPENFGEAIGFSYGVKICDNHSI